MEHVHLASMWLEEHVPEAGKRTAFQWRCAALPVRHNDGGSHGATQVLGTARSSFQQTSSQAGLQRRVAKRSPARGCAGGPGVAAQQAIRGAC